MVFSDVGVKKITIPKKVVYMAKSGIGEEDFWDIRWSTDYAIAKSSVIYSEQKWDNTENSFTGKVLSIVGPYISYREESGGYSQGAAHSWKIVFYETLNFTTGKKVKLIDIFKKKEVFQALLNDGIIKNALNGQSPKNLAELLQQADGDCEFYLSENSLSSFVFHHIKGNKVAVRLGLKYGCEAMRGNFTVLGFYLQIPQDLRKSFAKAKKNKLLMNEMIKLKY